MVTTRTFCLLRRVGSKFHSANDLETQHPHDQYEPVHLQLASLLLLHRWKADRYVRCLYNFEEECMKSRISSFGLPAALLSASLFGACQNTARGVELDTK